MYDAMSRRGPDEGVHLHRVVQLARWDLHPQGFLREVIRLTKQRITAFHMEHVASRTLRYQPQQGSAAARSRDGDVIELLVRSVFKCRLEGRFRDIISVAENWVRIRTAAKPHRR